MICQCPTTHRVLNNTRCVPRKLGDPCSGSNAECGLILDAECSPKTLTCSCPNTHYATKTLVNMLPPMDVDGYISAWRLVDACRPSNGAFKSIGQRCTNSLQCLYGHICARCEPGNLKTTKTCNIPSCSSTMCKNGTCPLCPRELEVKPTTTTTTPRRTTTTTTTPRPTTKVIELPKRTTTPPHFRKISNAVDLPNEEWTFKDTIPEATTASAEIESFDIWADPQEEYQEPSHDEYGGLENTKAPEQLVEVFMGDNKEDEEKEETADEPPEERSNIGLAVSLSFLCLFFILGGLGGFLWYTWDRFNWRRPTVCVEALETASSAASGSSFQSSRKYPYEDPTIITSDTPPAPSLSYNEEIIAKAPMSLLARQLEQELLDNSSTINSNSALTTNFKNSNPDAMLAPSSKRMNCVIHGNLRRNHLSHSMHHLTVDDINTQPMTPCTKHKYCFHGNTSDDMEFGPPEVPPRLPSRSKSVRSFAPTSDNNFINKSATSNRYKMESRLDLDRKRALQY